MTWKKKLLFAGITTLALFLCIEISLAVLGVKPTREQKDPFGDND